MDHALIVNGDPVVVQPQPITGPNNVQHPAAIFRLWTRAEKVAVGLYEIEREAIPAGQRATDWVYTLDGDHVNGVPALEAIPPSPVGIDIEALANAVAPTIPQDEPLTLGRYYRTGDQVVQDGTTYDVIQSFTYHDAGWTVASLAAHLQAVAPPSGSPWSGDSVPYAVDDLVTFDGRLYRCQQAHTSQAGWTPVAVPALWIDEGPI